MIQRPSLQRFCLASLLVATSIVTAHAQDKPSWLHEGDTLHTDGQSNDLVTAGMDADAMSSKPPAYADPEHPTAAELRRTSIFARRSVGQGYGRLFGPAVDLETGKPVGDNGKIAGDEILAFEDDGSGKQNVAMLLQIPQNLSSERRCIVAIPVAGSASLYRDIVDFGYWGLRHRCAVVYTDKGHGNGFHLLEPNTVNGLDGRIASPSRPRIRNRTRKRTGA